MKRAFLLVAVGATAVGAGSVVIDVPGRGVADDREATRAAPASGSYVAQSTGSLSGNPLDGPEPGLQVRAGSRAEVGEFELRSGRKLRLQTADTIDGNSCVINLDPGSGQSSICLEGGLFERRRAAFFVNSNGGPERFSELYLGGVAVPGIGVVALVKTDGGSVELPLNGSRAFLYESTTAELERDVLPTALRLYGRSGRLVETITIPGLR